jgi:hypothetical protein
LVSFFKTYDPFQYIIEYGCIQTIINVLAFLQGTDQSGLPQYFQVMADAGFGNIELPGYFSCCQILFAEQIEYLPAYGIVERFKKLVQVFR